MEIERKFLVKNNWQDMARVHHSCTIVQAYLFSDENKSVRVRLLYPLEAYLTVKLSVSSMSRHEFEYEIPVDHARKMIAGCTKLIKKTRYLVWNDELGRNWEIDVFEDENEGLTVAEIELDSEDQEISLPNWIGLEVTDVPDYLNVNLINNPYTLWGEV